MSSTQKIMVAMELSFLPFDILFVISEYITSGGDWKNFVWVSKDSYKLNTRKKINYFANHLETLLKTKIPENEWNYKNLSWNPSITINFITNYPSPFWDWNGLSRNPSLSFDFVLSHLHLKWNWYYLSENPCVN